MKIFCPVHKTEPLHQLQFHALDVKKAKKTGLRQGKTIKTNLQYCIKCNKAYNPKVTFK